MRNRLNRQLDRRNLLRKCPEIFYKGESGLPDLREIFEEVKSDMEKDYTVNFMCLDLKRLCLWYLSKGSYRC